VERRRQEEVGVKARERAHGKLQAARGFTEPAFPACVDAMMAHVGRVSEEQRRTFRSSERGIPVVADDDQRAAAQPRGRQIRPQDQSC
jgi:hypothetical protein